MTLFELALIGAMIVLNGIFAAYEMALASIPHARLVALVNQKRRGAQAALFMKERMEASLAVVQLGITLAGAIAAATGGAGVDETVTPWLLRHFDLGQRTAEFMSLILFVIPLSAFTIAFAELIPKTFALSNKEAVCIALSPFMRAIAAIFWPAVNLFEKSVKAAMRFLGQWRSKDKAKDVSALHELTAAATLARASRLISAHEERIVLSAAQLSTRRIGEVVVPVGDISMIPIHLSLPEALIRAHMDLHTRFPVCDQEGDPQTIRGYVTFKDIVLAIKMHVGDSGLRGIVRPIKRLPENEPIARVLEDIIRDKVHIALVETHDHRVLGLITLEDIMEELVGEIEDEFDRLPAYLHPVEGGWIVGGGTPMTVVCKSTEVPLGDLSVGQRVLTLAQWVENVLARKPHRAELIESQGLKVQVRKLRRKRLGEAFLTLSRPKPT